MCINSIKFPLFLIDIQQLLLHTGMDTYDNNLGIQVHRRKHVTDFLILFPTLPD